jgi:hypothetical protein
MKHTVIVGGHLFTFEAIDGEVTLNGSAATQRELRALGEMVHHVRISSDLQRSALRRKLLRPLRRVD